MKKILFPLLLLLCSLQMSASLRQTNYRWRNDDGNETTATWKAATNTFITVNDTSKLRLRIELDNDNEEFEFSTVEDQLQYSTDNGTTWIDMTNAPSQPFVYETSTNLTNLQATTNQMGSGTFGTYVAGHVVMGTPGASTLDLDDGERTELEWVIRPTSHALPNTTYIFQVVDLEDGALHFAEIHTGCIGVYVLSKQDGARCGPGTVTLNATPSSAAIIEWYDAAVGGNLVGSGNQFITPSLNATTTYYAAAKMSGGTCYSATRTAVTATVNPIPVVSLGDDVTVCANTPVTLNAGGSYSYLWDNGSTQITRTVNAPGNYYVTVTGPGGCKQSDTVTVSNHPRPVVDLGNDTLICPGKSILLDAGNTGDTYLWDNGSMQETRTVNTAGNFSVVVTNQFNCTGTDVINVIVKDMPLGEINATHGDTATYTFNVVNGLYAVDYIWDFGDGTPAVHGFQQEHVYTHNGVYMVKLAMMGDCDTNAYRQRTVDVYDVPGTSTGIGNVALKNVFSLYPNPAKEIIYLSFTADVKVNDIDLFNVLGQKVSSLHPRSKSNISISTNGLANGIYSVRINTDKGFAVEKLEVRR